MQNRLSSLLAIGALILAAVLLTGCAQTPMPRDFSAFKASKPRSILVLPPLNDSPDMRATYSFMTTVTRPLAESGYYVFPVALVDQTFKENGLPTPGDMHQAPLDKIGEIFGADAALFITIERYGVSSMIINNAVVVEARARLVDTRNGQQLWSGSARASDDENQRSGSNGLVSSLLTSLIQHIADSLSDPGHDIAKIASQRLFKAGRGDDQHLLFGPRSPEYGKN